MEGSCNNYQFGVNIQFSRRASSSGHHKAILAKQNRQNESVQCTRIKRSYHCNICEVTSRGVMVHIDRVLIKQVWTVVPGRHRKILRRSNILIHSRKFYGDLVLQENPLG